MTFLCRLHLLGLSVLDVLTVAHLLVEERNLAGRGRQLVPLLPRHLDGDIPVLFGGLELCGQGIKLLFGNGKPLAHLIGFLRVVLRRLLVLVELRAEAVNCLLLKHGVLGLHVQSLLLGGKPLTLVDQFFTYTCFLSLEASQPLK